MTDQELEISRLKAEIERLQAALQTALEGLRKVQQATEAANCKAVYLVNHMQGTNR